MPKTLEESPVLDALKMYFDEQKQLAIIGKLAVRLFDCQCEFEDYPGSCGEHEEALDGAILNYKAMTIKPIPVSDPERIYQEAWQKLLAELGE